MPPPPLSAATREKLLRRVEAEMAGARTWRAKEILRGALPQVGMDAAVFERYGQVLEALGERLEAGKYYFLSGVRRPEYQGCIDLFVARHRRASLAHLLAQFPNTVKRVEPDQFPPTVADDLKSLGLPSARTIDRLLRYEILPHTVQRAHEESPWQPIAVVVVLVLFASIVVGLYHIVGWILGWAV